MGNRGPVNKPNPGRISQNKAQMNTVIVRTGAVVPYKANSRWHPVAKLWYGSLMDSGQSDTYEPSDWGRAYWVAQRMSDYQRAPFELRRPAELAEIRQGQRDLMDTHRYRLAGHIETVRESEPTGDAEDSEPDNIITMQRRFS